MQKGQKSKGTGSSPHSPFSSRGGSASGGVKGSTRILVREGFQNPPTRGRAAPFTKGELKKGIIRIAGKSLGFVEIEGMEDDVMIEPENLNRALHKDEVEISLLAKKVKGRTVGQVENIVERAKSEFVGTFERENGQLFLKPDDKKMYTDIAITGGKTPEAKDGIKALVEITRWDASARHPEGNILKIIGKKGVHDVEMAAIVLGKGFDTEFPPEVEREALRQAQGNRITPEETSKRRDFRNTLTFTIDPVDAKDFDDAISFREIPNHNHQTPNYEIGVHIADVSHFVREHTALDREARKRGFSVYLVDRTIPMLPEALSNEVCSLNPDEDRLTFSAVFEMTSEGKVLKRWFGKSVIHSAKRFTYEAAQSVLDGKSSEHKEALDTLNSIAKKLRNEKFKMGAIDFEQDEVRFELGENGRPLKIYKKERLDTHKLVEEYMLLANREVAQFIFQAREKKQSKEPFIYRIHDVPDKDRIANLGIFVKALGHDLTMRGGGQVSAKDLQMLFEKIEGRAEESMIKTAAVRSMAKAIYSTGNIGHFGLAFEYYTHFTSPIRRYADLLVHRILFHHLSGTSIPPRDWDSYEKMARENTEQEIAAAEAERDSKKMKQVEYMSERVGQEFLGIISGVTEWGMYIEEKDTRSEGMVKLRDLGDDYYNLDEKNYCLVGEKTKKKYSLGDAVRFKVVGADVERKTLDYALA